MPTRDPKPLTYRDAGVDIDRGNRLVEQIRDAAARTRRAETLAGVGGFGALFQLPAGRYREPVLVSGTDGVGTKLRLAITSGRHRGVGVDLVAMCVNDILTSGAEPLFFLDYFATGTLDAEVACEVVNGIADGCELAGAALVGGETAEMPGMYAAGDYDLAGFCVGVVERDAILDGSEVRPGDVILGLASSGPHSNGYSLVRRILDRDGTALGETLADGARLGDALMAPTRIYVRPLLDSLRRQPGQIHALAHITGGGLTENVPRVLPRGCHARIATGAWPWPPVFEWLAERGPVAQHEMLRTFNCGIGMVVVCDAARADVLAQQLTEAGERVYRIGSIEACDGDARISIE